MHPRDPLLSEDLLSGAKHPHHFLGQHFAQQAESTAPHVCKFIPVFGAPLVPTHSQQVNHREKQDLTLNSFAFADITSTLDDS